MPVGLLVVGWNESLGIEIHVKYPELMVVSEELLMQVYNMHTYTRESGMVSVMIGPLNVASYYTGSATGLYIILVLNIDDDPDIYESGLADVSRIILQNFEDNAYIEMIPYIFQRLSAYSIYNIEQLLVITYLDEVKRLVINRLREEGVVSKSEIKIWLNDMFREGFIDLDSILNDFINIDLIKVEYVKGMSSALIFLTNDLMMFRQPPINILTNPVEKGLPEQFVREYKFDIKTFFQTYQPSEKDNLQIIDTLIDPQVYETFRLLRTNVVTKNRLYKLEKKGVYDIDGVLKKLWDNQLIKVFQDKQDTEYYALRTDFKIDLFFPKYITNTIQYNWKNKFKSDQVLIEYLTILKDVYRNKKSKNIDSGLED